MSSAVGDGGPTYSLYGVIYHNSGTMYCKLDVFIYMHMYFLCQHMRMSVFIVDIQVRIVK